MSARRILFVCSGNTCRSPLAERLARREAEERGLDDVEVRSAGTFAGRGAPASRGAVLAARRQGLDLSGHRSTPLGPELVEWADLVLAMTNAHLRVATDVGGGEKAALVTEYLPEDHPEYGREVGDPAGAGVERYEEVLRLLETAVGGVLDAIDPDHVADADSGRREGG